MAPPILQINFRFTVARAAYEGQLSALADEYARIPGLVWKIWLMNEERSEAGGIYLFDAPASLDAFLQSPLAAAAAAHPAFTGFEVKRFEVLEGPSLSTRAPLG